VYRYDGDAKQWKERGVGDVKILKHPERGTFRILLRREQVMSTTVVICQSYQ
jgi:E3 SUMO-protein ligase RanBP2